MQLDCVSELLEYSGNSLLHHLLNTGDLDNSDENDKGREIVSKLCFPMAVDPFDGIEMIDTVLEEREHDFGIPKTFSTAMIALACFSFTVLVYKNSPKRGRKFVSVPHCAAIIVQIVCVNLPFLVICAMVFVMFGKEESIFIAKNGIAMVLSILEICNLRRLRRVGQEDEVVKNKYFFVAPRFHFKISNALSSFYYLFHTTNCHFK